MSILKTFILIFLLSTVVKAAEMLKADAYEQEMSLVMCHSLDHRFDPESHACVSCARGLHYDHALRCIGTPDVLEKCAVGAHYHGKTQECMYCAQGYVFHEDEDLRECTLVKGAKSLDR